MRDQLYINDQDAFLTWGVTLESSSLASLLNMAPVKPMIENKSCIVPGKEVMDKPLLDDERTILLTIILKATTQDQFIDRVELFEAALKTGILAFKVMRLKKTYYLSFISSNSFNTYAMGQGKFLLKFSEPNPSNRISL